MSITEEEQTMHDPQEPILDGTVMVSPKALARAAGVLYLLMALLGAFAHVIVRAGIRVPGDAAATAANIVADASLFRLGFVADIGMATLFVFVGILLYLLLRHVDRKSAGAMVVFVTVGAGMILVKLLFHYAALLVAIDPSYTALGDEGSNALVLLLVDMHHHGYSIAGVFFGLWLLPLGYLAYRSGIFPRVLGVLLMIAGVSWIIDTLTRFLAPDLPEIVSLIITAPTFAEFWMILYLVVKGVRPPGSTSSHPPRPERATMKAIVQHAYGSSDAYDSTTSTSPPRS